mgnify:CR=1 FL=1
MKVTWLGQAGLLFENENLKIMVDPYLSDSLSSKGESFKRRLFIDEKYFETSPNVILITHAHEDHLNMETLTYKPQKRYLFKL